jgi:phosphopantothenoylcysteine decarboxylase/phosphopantothenate--cysteine ligase
MKPSDKKKIVIGITGGIAAYKMCSVVSYLATNGYDVHVVMTENAKRFVGAMTFSALSGNPVIDDDTEWNPDGDINHIILSKANLLVIAPATANTIAKLAHGMADNVLTAMALAHTGEIIIAPAMNVNMYENDITKENMRKLSDNDYEFIDPVVGMLACKDEGMGKLADTRDIIKAIEGKL